MATEQQLDRLTQIATTCSESILALQRVAAVHTEQIGQHSSQIDRLSDRIARTSDKIERTSLQIERNSQHTGRLEQVVTALAEYQEETSRIVRQASLDWQAYFTTIHPKQ